MKNKILFGLLIVLILFSITGCGKSNIKLTDKDIEFVLKEDTLTSSGATFILENNSGHDISFGEPYYLEKEKNGKWREVEPIETLNFILPLYILKPGESKEMVIDWEYGYGKLKSGKYRVVKVVSGDNVAGEFVIK